MLKTLKKMQEKGIFTLMNDDMNLDTLIKNAKTDEDIKNNISDIQDYIKDLHNECDYMYSIRYVGNHISDFCDKFHYEMFETYMSNLITNGVIYEKEISFGDAGVCKFGLSSSGSVKFTLEERKLIKLINHVYLNVRNEYYNPNVIYISLEKLKTLYSLDKNNLEFKESIIETCTKINSKRIYWNMENTRYNKTKGLKEKKLNAGKNEPIVDITIIYQPREHKSGINGKVNTIKGILCRVSNFMKLRYELSHICNNFPTISLRSSYLDFIVMERIIYHLHIIGMSNSLKVKALQDRSKTKEVKKSLKKNIRDEFKKKLIDLAREVYYYHDREQTTKDYFSKILNEPNSKRRIEELITSLATISEILYEYGYNSQLLIRGKAVDFTNLDNEKRKIKKANVICDEMLNSVKNVSKRGQLIKYLKDGEIEFFVKL